MWRDSLGDGNPTNTKLSFSGKCVLKRTFGEGCYKVLWVFGSKEEAEAEYQQWLSECDLPQ